MRRARTRTVVLVGLLVSLVIAGGVSYYASASPDGLEFVAEQVGFLDRAQDSAAAQGPLADYGVSGVADDRLSGGLAGVIGVAVTAALAFSLMWALRRRGARKD